MNPAPRSSRADVRNPLLALPEVAALRELPDDAQAALAALLRQLSHQASTKAEYCWQTHKPSMAAYWKSCFRLRQAHRPCAEETPKMKANRQHTLIRTAQTLTRELRKRVPLPRDPVGKVSGFTTVADGQEEVTFDVYLSEAGLRQLAERAAHNQRSRAIDGPLLIVVTGRRRI